MERQPRNKLLHPLSSDTGEKMKRILHTILKILAIGVLTFSLLLLFARFHWILDILTHFRLPYVVCFLLLLLVLLKTKLYPYSIVVLFCLLLQFIPLSRHYTPKFFNPQGTGPLLKVMSFNLWIDNKDFQAIENLVSNENPDIVCFQEYNSLHARGLTELQKVYPYSKAFPASYKGLLLLSKLPIEESHIHHKDYRIASIYMTAVLNWNGQKISLLNAHPRPPLTKQYSNNLHNTFDRIQRFVENQKHPTIVVGDFNCTAYSPSFKRLGSKLIDTSRGQGYTSSWQRFNLLVGIPIDQILHTKELTCVSHHIGQKSGSDHSPVIVSFQALAE